MKILNFNAIEIVQILSSIFFSIVFFQSGIDKIVDRKGNLNFFESLSIFTKLKILKLNVDENPQTPQKFGVRGIPTLMLFKNGEVVGTQVGAISKSDLINFIENNI